MASLRRLAKDHANLQSALPPNYLFADDEDGSSSDDLTQLVILVTGADGTPYASGLWRLSLKMPMDYPKSPPKATFKTRIYHPNVDEKTGAVCLETLKRDWDPKLTLKDILVTISCLLIQPNPDSALNAAAGALIQEDYEAFSTQAQLMTRIHAPIPQHMLAAVQEAKRRGEDADHKPDSKHVVSQATPEQDDTKENDASGPGETSTCPRTSSQATIRAKRPLSELPLPEDYDAGRLSDTGSEPRRKSPKTTSADVSDRTTNPQAVATINQAEKATALGEDEAEGNKVADKQSCRPPYPYLVSGPVAVRKPMNGKRKGQPRVGIRRL
ncbi:hypothetical protein A1O7_05947 [Cladophialophora yegresii CBS 114405]|uniref:Ubiquitin-conjugating enzyme E2 2 n=1 Tax=Cladophialophora yegresii CBS 114405 TaxID=1182544 RepID=W9W1Y7_9EURO|nr:uncharacterized protein A1O7_05947 [Cladophialophora yegresii CBS 114405]EXJ58521.1 hypothetical protein A1O7_05947 [Cladophialophora yegresii CBS 114405]